jgi:phosphoribosyl 1,2-cyclic phosphodiesterase
MTVKLWGTRGSLAAPGMETARYGGNTSCVEVRGTDGTLLVLDAGTGIRRLGATVATDVHRVDVLLTHLHMDHIQGLGFFAPLFREGLEVHLWGPASATASLRSRLMRYLSPPLFPVHLRDVACHLSLHEVPCPPVAIGELRISSDLVCHPGPTVGYRIESERGVATYLPDHEPALGARTYPPPPEWTSGYSLAEGADLLIHDAQYTSAEYDERVGWGHSSIEQTVRFAQLAGVRHLVTFHHDPSHDDWTLDQLTGDAAALAPLAISPGTEGSVFAIGKNQGAATPAT